MEEILDSFNGVANRVGEEEMEGERGVEVISENWRLQRSDV